MKESKAYITQEEMSQEKKEIKADYIYVAIQYIIRNINKYKDFVLIRSEKRKNINSNLKAIVIKPIKIIIKFIILLNLIFEIKCTINIDKKLLNNNTEITLKINKIGKQTILYYGYLNNKYPCPSEIYLNGYIQNLQNCSEIDIRESNSIVKLIWNNPLYTIDCLFCFSYNVIEINFINFDSSLLNFTGATFGYCYSLLSVDLTKLNTKNSYFMGVLFQHCHSIKSINLGNFDTSNVKYFRQMFQDCPKLEYINLENFIETDVPDIINMFDGIAKNAVICIKKNKAKSIYNLIKSYNSQCFTISCEADWRKVQKKIDNDTNNCLDDCSLSENNKYEYEGRCYSSCPKNTINFNNKCCTMTEAKKGVCKINIKEETKFETKEESKEEIKKADDKAVENIKEILKEDFDTSEIDEGKDITIELGNGEITISSSYNQKNDKASNKTSIDLGDCETKLKDVYQISEEKALYILKRDVIQEGYQIPLIVYEVYFPSFGDQFKLDLSVCKDIKIDTSIPIKLSVNDLDKANSSSNYYNDICYTYTSEDGTDVSLLDRKKILLKIIYQHAKRIVILLSMIILMVKQNVLAK